MEREAQHAHPSADAAPVVIGIGRTGLRVASQLAASAGHGLRLLTIFPGQLPPGPSPVPIVAWPMDRALWPEATIDLRSRIGSPGAAVIALGLGAEDAAAIAEGVAMAVSECAATVAAVGVSPFSFEGASKLETADAVVKAVAPTVELFAIARRDNVRAVAPSDTPLQRACQMVDDIAAQATEAIARMLALSSDALDHCGVCFVGAAAAEGASPLADAVRAALTQSLLDRDAVAGSAGALLALALGTVPTLGEICAAEDLIRGALAPGARVSFGMAIDPHLAGRALAAVCVSQDAPPESESVFPSEDPRVLDIPAFLRRRSARPRSRATAGYTRWPRSA
jgi:cell division GTPase FtsZ